MHEPPTTISAPAPDLASALLQDLNPEQRRAVTHGEGPLLIIAGAGTGKTTTLAHRVAHHIVTGTDPGRILLLTFTRKAAAEMLRRVDGLLRRLEASPASAAGPDAHVLRAAARTLAGRRVWGGTFHATATRLLRLHGKNINLDPSFTILDRSDSEDLMNVVRSELGLARTDRRFPLKATCLDIYSRCVNAQERLDDVLQKSFPWCRDFSEDLKVLFSAYVDRKAEQSVLDYDDLLLFWHGLLSDPVAGAAVRARFDRVLVDEYQDTNRLQAEILHRLRPGGTGVTAVGDDAQAVYSFRAATVRNILDFPNQVPGTTAVTLQQNYRSVAPILTATNRIIAQARERHAKDLWTARPGEHKPCLVRCQDEEEQTDFVVERVLEHREAGILLRRQAVLFRASHHSLALEMELARRNIPFVKYGGLKFAETAHVKDLLAFLRLAENPRDVMAGTRVLMLLPGVGPKKARDLVARLITDGAHPFAAWAGARAPAPAAAHLWPDLIALLSGLAGPDPGEVPGQIHRIRALYAPLLERLHDNPRARLLDLEQLEHLSGRFPDRSRFLAEITLDPPNHTGDFAGPPLLDEDYLILSTIHSAKGLEWDSVYVIHAADGNIPSDMATGTPEEIDEELRLFYVALTRARDFLYVCCPLRYYPVPRRPTDAHGYAQITRFLPEAIRPLFDQPQIGPAAPAGADVSDGATPATTVTAHGIRQGLKEMW
ncbi:MAG: ATP-dependent helicase [Thermoleophilia bacterium]|nr:ATP-dependent helicase [Thermoleophilia bacterium]